MLIYTCYNPICLSYKHQESPTDALNSPVTTRLPLMLPVMEPWVLGAAEEPQLDCLPAERKGRTGKGMSPASQVLARTRTGLWL